MRCTENGLNAGTTAMPGGNQPIDVDEETCLAAYVLWLAPCVSAAGALVFGILCFFLQRALRKPERPINVAAKIFACLIIVSCIGIWAAASVAGAGMRVANAAMMFLGVGLFLIGCVIVATVGFRNISHGALSIPLIRRISRSVFSDWIKAIFVMFLLPLLYAARPASATSFPCILRDRTPSVGLWRPPLWDDMHPRFSARSTSRILPVYPQFARTLPFRPMLTHSATPCTPTPSPMAPVGPPRSPFYAALSAVNQLARKCMPCTKALPETERHLRVTVLCHNQMEAMRSWRWTSILVKTVYVGLFYALISVGVGKVVTLILSALNDALAPLSLAAVTFIFMGVGLTMFLAPPVPGVPVYLAAGVILTPAAEPTMGFWGALMFGSAIGFILKMLAIVMQQKVIGERMSVSGGPHARTHHVADHVWQGRSSNQLPPAAGTSPPGANRSPIRAPADVTGLAVHSPPRRRQFHRHQGHPGHLVQPGIPHGQGDLPS